MAVLSKMGTVVGFTGTRKSYMGGWCTTIRRQRCHRRWCMETTCTNLRQRVWLMYWLPKITVHGEDSSVSVETIGGSGEAPNAKIVARSRQEGGCPKWFYANLELRSVWLMMVFWSHSWYEHEACPKSFPMVRITHPNSFG